MYYVLYTTYYTLYTIYHKLYSQECEKLASEYTSILLRRNDESVTMSSIETLLGAMESVLGINVRNHHYFTLIHPYTHTLIHSYTHTLIHSYTHTLIHYI